MSLFEKLKASMDNEDTPAFLALLHDDFVFVRHQSGTTMSKADMAAMMAEMEGATGWSVENQRCIYENDDILVEHSVMSFPDGTREAILGAHTLKDGQIIRMETGATLLS